jgi:hypothetical protein
MRVPKFGAMPATSAGFRAARSPGIPTPPGLAQAEQISQAMSTFGQGVGALGEQMQVEVDEAEVQSAANKFDEYTRGVLDPMKGFRSKLGRDAKDGYEQAVQDLEGKRKEFGNTLQNARQRELYERYSNSRRDRTRSFLDNHAATQVRAYNIGEKKATVDGHAQDYVGLMTLPTPDDPAAAARLMQERRYALAELRQTTGDYADLQGQGPQERAQTVRNAERAAHAGVVQGLIAAGRYDEAEAMMRTGDDDAGIDYYMDDAIAAGIEPEDGHWASRVPNGPNRGMILKKPHHPTFHKTLKGEKAAGMKWFYRPDNGRYYTFPDGENPGEEYAEQEPSAEEMRASLTPLEREKYRAQIKRGRTAAMKTQQAAADAEAANQMASELNQIVSASEAGSEGPTPVDELPSPSQRAVYIRGKVEDMIAKRNLPPDEADRFRGQAMRKIAQMQRDHLEQGAAAYDEAMQFLRENPEADLSQLPNINELRRTGQLAAVAKTVADAQAPQREAMLESVNTEIRVLLDKLEEGGIVTVDTQDMADLYAMGMDTRSVFTPGVPMQWSTMTEDGVRGMLTALGVTDAKEVLRYMRSYRALRGGTVKSEREAQDRQITQVKKNIVGRVGLSINKDDNPTQAAFRSSRRYALHSVMESDEFLRRYGLHEGSSGTDWEQAMPGIIEDISQVTDETSEVEGLEVPVRKFTSVEWLNQNVGKNAQDAITTILEDRLGASVYIGPQEIADEYLRQLSLPRDQRDPRVARAMPPPGLYTSSADAIGGSRAFRDIRTDNLVQPDDRQYIVPDTGSDEYRLPPGQQFELVQGPGGADDMRLRRKSKE